MNFLKLSLVAGFLLPSIVAADCATDQMLVATTSMSSPTVQRDSFAAKPKVLYKAGTKYGRIEEQIDAENHIHGLVVVNEPDIWMVNLFDSTGQHIVDPGPVIEFHAPILSGTISDHWKTFEFGSEVAFMRAHSVVPLHQASRSGDVYLHTFEGTTATLHTTAAGTPTSVEVKAPDDQYTVNYFSYECRKLDTALFAKPDGIHYSEAEHP